MNAERSRLEGRLTAVRNRIDAAYVDKLDGKISEEFWERKHLQVPREIVEQIVTTLREDQKASAARRDVQRVPPP
jgi:hypothetical protein